MLFDLTKFQTWIQKSLSDIPSPEVFRLQHENGETLQTFQLNDDDQELQALKIAEETMNAAAEHVEAFEVSQRYKLVAFDDEDIEIGQMSFRRSPTRGAPAEEGELIRLEHTTRSQEPTDPDLVAVLTRHIENREKNFNTIMEAVVGNLISENQHLRKSREKMDEIRFDYFEKREALIGEQHIRDLERDEHEAAEKRKAQAWEKALEYAPDVLKFLLMNALKGQTPQMPPPKSPGANGANGANGATGTAKTRDDQEALDNALSGMAEDFEQSEPTIPELQASVYAVVMKMGGYPKIRADLPEELREDLDAIVGLGKDPESIHDFRNAGFRVLMGIDQSVLLSLSGELDEAQSRMLAFLMTPTG